MLFRCHSVQGDALGRVLGATVPAFVLGTVRTRFLGHARRDEHGPQVDSGPKEARVEGGVQTDPRSASREQFHVDQPGRVTAAHVIAYEEWFEFEEDEAQHVYDPFVWPVPKGSQLGTPPPQRRSRMERALPVTSSERPLLT